MNYRKSHKLFSNLVYHVHCKIFSQIDTLRTCNSQIYIRYVTRPMNRMHARLNSVILAIKNFILNIFPFYSTFTLMHLEDSRLHAI